MATKKNIPQTLEVNDYVNNSINIKHSFGCSTLSQDTLQSYPVYDNDRTHHQLVYAVGKSVCIHDLVNGSQQFTTGKLSNIRTIHHFILSPSNRYLSVCESVRKDKDDIEAPAIISIYNLTTFSRYKTLIYKSESDFICSEFCGDPKYLASLTTEPSRSIVIWSWEKEKITKVIPLDNINVNCLRSSPSSTVTTLTGSGPGVLKCWVVTNDVNNAVIKPLSLLVPSKEADSFITHAWLPTASTHEFRMVALAETIDGVSTTITAAADLTVAPSTKGSMLSRSKSSASLESSSASNRPITSSAPKQQLLYIFEGNDTDGASTLDVLQVLQLKLPLISNHDNEPPRIETVNGTEKGFILLGNNGFIAVYEKSIDNKTYYSEIQRLNIGDICLIGAISMSEEEGLCVMSKTNRLIKVNLLISPTADPLSEKITSVQQLKTRTFLTNNLANHDIDLFTTRDTLTSNATDIAYGGLHTMPIRASDIAKDR